MSLSVKFDGQELSEILTVTKDFTPFLGVSWDISTYNNNGALRGENFHYSTFKGKTISMPFKFRYDVADKYDNLERILNVDEPKPLIFGNIPDRVFYAVPKGNLNFKEIAFLGKGTIEWFIPDGVAHANVTKTTTQTYTNEDGILEMVVQNKGTEWAPISFEIENTSDNGYIGIVSEHGVMQFGNIEEADKEIVNKNETLNSMGDFSKWLDDNGTNIQNPNNTANGSLKETTLDGKKILTINQIGSGSNLHGGMRKVLFPADSNGDIGAKNWDCYYEIGFHSSAPGQTGAITLCFFDKDNNDVVSFIVYKNDTQGLTANVVFSANHIRYGEVIPYNSGNDGINPFRVDKGWMSVTKIGNKVRFYVFGKNFEFNVDSIANKEVVGAQVFMGQYGTRGDGKNIVPNIFLRKFMFQKVNVEKWVDVPNKFYKGCMLYVDGETKLTYINGRDMLTDSEVRGTKYFKVPPGETKIQFYYSSFATAPKIKSIIREVFL